MYVQAKKCCEMPVLAVTYCCRVIVQLTTEDEEEEG